MEFPKEVEEATKNPKIIHALQMALQAIGEEDNTSLKLINYGGQGLIYKIRCKEYSYPLLIKVPFYSPKHPSDTIAEHGILKEASVCDAIEKVCSGVIPKMIAFDPKGLYMIREFLEGSELADVLKKSDDDTRDKILVQEFELVKKLFPVFHENPSQSYTIRDLKPRNMIYTDKNEIYMIDCGSCRPEANMLSTDRESALKRFGSGKYQYWPIEQLIEDPELCDRRVDYFSWGVMAYYTLFLKRPYANDTKDINEAKAEYARRYELACHDLEQACLNGRLSCTLKENIIAALHPDAKQRKFII